MYVGMGFFLYGSVGSGAAIVIVGIAVACEGSIGQWVAASIGPGRIGAVSTTTLLRAWAISWAIMMAFGSTGVFLAAILRRIRLRS